MNITVIGAGYVGLVTGTCFAEFGNHVTCVDVNAKKIQDLQNGILPIYEPGLEPIVMSNMELKRLNFTTSLELAPDPDVIFIAVGTPSNAEGAADIKYVLEAARNIGAHINKYCVIVDKSTVPVGMADQVYKVIRNELQKRNLSIKFDVVSNPEFLREGAAIEDFMQPDRIIIGLDSDNAKDVMLNLYTPIVRSTEKIFFMSVKDAEMTKYAANAMLATRISFMNEIALLCDQMGGVDIENVRVGIGSDSRIGSAFLNPGCGYGGSCFPKDVRALVKMMEQYHIDPMVLNAVEARNRQQKHLLAQKVSQIFGNNLSGFTFGIWGLSFKPGTDDMREASSLVLIDDLIRRGARIQAYDPEAMEVARHVIPQEYFAEKKIILVEKQYDALIDVDAMILVTEWKPFCYPDLDTIKKMMRKHIIIDGRNQYDPQSLMKAGFQYFAIGRGYSPAMLQLEKAVAN